MRILFIFILMLIATTSHAEWTYKEQARHPSSDGGTIDVFVEFSDSVTGEVRNGQYRFLNDKDADINITSRMSKAIDSIVNEPVPETTYQKSEVEILLKEKGCLQSTETLSDLKPLSEIVKTVTKIEVVK